MCGIYGIVDFNKTITPKDLKSSIDTLSHRGPDDRGIEMFNTENAIVGLAHARLSILDLTMAGHQPMKYKNLTIILNGEIYNYKEIRAELIENGYTFISNSDTEVVLKSFDVWSINCVDKFSGMFSFAIYDELKNKIYLCRDRAGIKPLYIYNDGVTFSFASEIKSFHKQQSFNNEINKDAVYFFIQFGYIPGNISIFNYVSKVPPASWMIYDINERRTETIYYWKLDNFFKLPLLDISYQEAAIKLENLLYSACTYRMISDVPVGIFLSGGYDSTLITAILQRNSDEKLNTFTIGFPDGIDETEYAKKVSGYLGTNHSNLNLSHKGALEIIAELPYYYDEPLADISSIPTILVSRFARQNVKVALSADGGDELFAGYEWYRTFFKRYEQLNSIPHSLSYLVNLLLSINKNIIFKNNYHQRYRFDIVRNVLATDKKNRLSELLYQTRKLSDDFNKNLFIEYRSIKPEIYNENYSDFNDTFAPMLYIDYKMNLTDCLLVKVDRATMSASLEGREPLMDHRLTEFAAQLPTSFKYDGNNHKKILKDIVHKYLPKEIMQRPKVGFDLPLTKYLRGELSYLIDDYLSITSISKTGYFNPVFVNKIVKEFRSNKLVYSPVIWRLIVFQQ